MKQMIGIDLGGTNIRVAKIDEAGNILQEIKTPSYAQEGREKVLENMISLIHQIEDYQSCAGIGIGVPGPCDQETGMMSMSTNLPGFKDFPLVETLQNEIGLPVYLENDADVAGLAEALLGAGKGKHVVYYFTLSTGIGGGLIVDGKVVSGYKGFGGEVANVIIDRNRQKRNHLAPGAVENEASGTHIVRKANELLAPKTVAHAGEVFALAKEGNQDMMQLVDEATTDLALMFAAVSAIVAPDIFVLGGGMMKSKDDFLPTVIEKYKTYVHESIQDTPFVEAELAEPGILGAAMLVQSHQV